MPAFIFIACPRCALPATTRRDPQGPTTWSCGGCHTAGIDLVIGTSPGDAEPVAP